MRQNRRSFLAALGGATAALACGRVPAAGFGALPQGGRRLSRVGIQLYTLRRVAQADLAGTLGRLSKIGYKEIEFAGYYNRPATEVRDMLAANGLTAPSVHVGVDVIEQSPARLFDESKIVGHEWITVPSLPSGPKATVDDWRRIAARFNKAAAVAKAAGFRFAFHNHNAELAKVGGQVPLEILITETDPALVSYEMDIYWTVVGGADPLDLLARHPGRFKMLHVKDSAGPPDNKMVDVGAGTIDFKTIFARARGIEHYFVEHDNPADPIASAATSHDHLSTLTF